jgi:multiple sugar transport system permease protein
METPESLRVMNGLVETFEKVHPGIRVQVENVRDEYTQKLLTQFAAKVAPDTAQLSVNHYQYFASRGALMPLDDYVSGSDGIRLDDWYPNVLSFFRFEGRLYGLPRDVGPFGLLFYNREAFRRAGIPYPDGSWTWDFRPRPELREKCFTWVLGQLTSEEQFGFSPQWPQLWFQLLLNSRGLKLWDSDSAPRKVLADSPEVLQLMQFARDAITRDRWIPSYDMIATERQSDVFKEFGEGRIAIIATFANYMPRLRTEFPNLDWDVTLFPRFRERPRAFAADSGATVIFSTSRHPRESWLWARWVSGEQGQTAYAKAGISQPANRRLANTEGIWLYGAGMPQERKVPAGLKVADEAALSMVFAQTPEYFEDTRNSLDNAAFDILNGARPVDNTLRRVTNEAQARLDSALREIPTQPFPLYWGIAIGVVLAAGVGLWVFWPERNLNYSRKERIDNRTAYLFLTPMLIGLIGLTLGPMIYSLLLSTTNSDIIRPPMWVGASNYRDALTVDPLFWTSLRVTLVYTVLSTPAGIGIALALALLLNTRVRGMAIYRACFYLPSLASAVAASLAWMRIFNPENGLLNRLIYGPDGQRNLLGLGEYLSRWAGDPSKPVNWLASESTVLPAFVIMGLWGAGGGTIIFLAGLQGISKTYYEAAEIDGAGPLRQFRHITYPLLTPTLFFSLITGLIGSFQVFTQAFVITRGGPNNATMFYMLNLYLQGFQSLKMGYASALAWILFVIVLVITAIQLMVSKRWVFYEGEVPK